jgi:hypothetical protein
MPRTKGLPKSMGACADLLFATREKRLALQKQVDAIQAEETALRNHIIDNLAKGDDRGGVGKTHMVTVYTDKIPRIADPDALFAHIKKTGEFDLLQRRLNDKAVKERWEDPKNKKGVPGVEAFPIVKVSLTKKKGK